MSRAKVAVSLEQATLGRLDDLVRNAVFPSRSQSQKAGFPLTLELQGKNLPKRSWVKISQIRTLSVERVGRSLGRVAPEGFDNRDVRRADGSTPLSACASGFRARSTVIAKESNDDRAGA